MGMTVLEGINAIYKHLQTTVMIDANKPNGKLCKFQRPENSVKEDMVVNAIGNTRDAVQKGIYVVNLFVQNLNPDYYPHLDGDRSQPDTARLLYLTTLFEASVSGEIWEPNGAYCFLIQQDNVFEDTDNTHYASFRLEFYAINI